MIGGLSFMSLVSIRHLSFFYTIGVIEIGIICIRSLNELHDSTFDILGKILLENNPTTKILSVSLKN